MTAIDVKQFLAKRLKQLREERGLTQDDLAKALSVSRGSVSFYENADRMAGIDFIYKASVFFDCTTDYLLGVSDFKTEGEKIQYFHTEKILSENLNMLSDKEKGFLTHCLNHVLFMRKKIEKYVDLDIRLISSMLKCIGLAMETMNMSVIQLEENDYSKDENITKKTIEVYTNSILDTEMLRSKANQYMNSLFVELKHTYLDVLNKEMSTHCGENERMLKINALE